MDEKKFIKFLEYAVCKKKFNYREIVDEFKLSEEESKLLLVLVRNRELFAHDGVERETHEKLVKSKWYVSANDLFRLAQFKSYKETSRLTIITLVITILFSLTSIYLSIRQDYQNAEFLEDGLQKITLIEGHLSNIDYLLAKKVRNDQEIVVDKLDVIQKKLLEIKSVILNKKNISSCNKSL